MDNLRQLPGISTAWFLAHAALARPPMARRRTCHLGRLPGA